MTTGSKVFHRNLRTMPLKAVRAAGCHIWDEHGNRYFDASSSQIVSSLGHGHAEVRQALNEQLARVEFVHSSQFTTDAAETLAQRLTEGTDFAGVHFVSGGSEGVEAAIKLARQYQLERGQADRHKIIARRQSYHGGTLGALSVGGSMPRRAPFAPMLLNMPQVAPCYVYRDLHPDESEEAYGQRLAAELEHCLLEAGPASVAAFIVEPVAGAVLGAATPVQGYLQRVREVCDRHGVVLIFDEVMCGMGRTGVRYAHEREDATPDILIVGKGLAAGYASIGAVLMSQDIARTLREGSGGFVHGHTFMAHPLACAAALAVQDCIDRHGLIQRVDALGTRLLAQLKAATADNPHVGDVRGRGLFIAIEFVSDRQSKAPLAAQSQFHDRLRAALLAGGIACFTGAGTIDGRNGHHALVAPPFVAAEDDLSWLCAQLNRISLEVAEACA